MLRFSFACALIATSSLVVASNLQEANKLLEQKNFAAAMSAYQELAKNGNPDAQQSLGEMYWYGDGVKPDQQKAEYYFNLAATAGNARAKGFQKLIATRKEKQAEIQFYTQNYRGDDLRLTCKAPEIPGSSSNRKEIKAVAEELNGWHACFNSFVEHYNASLPPGSKIPKQIADLFNDQEAEQAQQLMTRVYSEVSEQAAKSAEIVKGKEESWRKATETYLVTRNLRNSNEYEMLNKMMRAENESKYQVLGSGAMPAKR